MSSTNGHDSSSAPGPAAPMGYGHDKKGTVVGAAKNDGKVHVTHRNEGSGDATVAFTLDGARLTRATARRSGRWRSASASSIPHLCYSPKPGYRPDGNCRVCMVEVEGERVLAASCIRTPTPGMKVKTQTERAKTRAPDGGRAAADRPAAQRCRARSGIREFWQTADRQNVDGEPVCPPRAAGARPQPSGDGGQSRRLHPVQSLRPRLPRSAGQRRHRHGRPRPRREDRVRLRRSDGRVDLRRLRRMRAGLPDRRADAGDAGRRSTTCARNIRTARSTACAPIAASAASSPTTSRTTSCSTSAAATARRTRTGSASRAASASTM